MSDSSQSEPDPGLGTIRKPADHVLSHLLSHVAEPSTLPMIVAVGGPGGTGKSTFSQSLADELPDAVVLALDDYRLPRKEREASGHLGSHPDANDVATIRRHIQSLKDSSPVNKPIYDTVKGSISGTETIAPGKIVILDGEISTYDCLMDLVDLSIYIDASWRTQLASRLSRDVEDHQFSHEKALSTFLQSNCNDAMAFGEAGKSRADIRLFSNEDYSMKIDHIRPDLAETLDAATPWDEKDVQGLVVPMTTPFKADLTIDESAFINHLVWLEECGVRRVLIGGTLGEFFSLSHSECRDLLRLARRHFSGVVYFQAGRENAGRTLDEMRMAEDNGADVLLILTPYYYADVGEEGLIDYFRSVCDTASLPVVLYNFTRHTQNTLTRKVLSTIPHFGLKDSDANLGFLPYTPRYYLGSDTGMVEAFAAGAFGFVSGSANFLPKEYVAFEASLLLGSSDAGQLQDIIDGGVAKSSGPNSIVRIKSMLAGTLPDYPALVRPPL